jgi:hypothetical protein
MALGNTVNLNSTTPAAPSGSVNLPFAADGGSPVANVSVSAPILVGDTGSGGTAGLAPAPPAGSAAAGKFLKADGTFAVPSGSGFANPMTTGGDIIYGGASGAATRLAAGTAGQVLQTNGTASAPTWVNPSSGGSGQTTVSGSVSGSAVFSQPFQGAYYKKIIILLESLSGTASYTFPTGFTATPDFFIGASASGATVTAISTSAVTISGAPSSGVIVLEGY